MSSTDFDELTKWLQKQADSIKFGEIILKITLHDGVRYIEKSISEKTKIVNCIADNNPFSGELK